MSEMAKEARRAMRAKAVRLSGGTNDPHRKVDASSWEPTESLNADRKTGARPVRPRIYRNHGGPVALQKDRGPRRADKKARADGGRADTPGAESTIDTAGANKKAFGSYHEGGYKKGGRTKRADGGDISDDNKKLAVRMGGDSKALGLGDYGKPKVSAMSDRLGPRYSKEAVDKAIASSNRSGRKIGDKEAASIHRLLKGRYADGGAAKDVHKHERNMHKGKPLTKLATGGKAENYWTYKAGSETPSLDAAIKAKAIHPDTTDTEWNKMSPGMKREIMRRKRARGGKAATINIVIAGGGPKQDPMQQGPQGPIKPMPPPMPPPGPMAGGPPPGGPPGLPPGMPPGGPPMPMGRKDGGRAQRADGGTVTVKGPPMSAAFRAKQKANREDQERSSQYTETPYKRASGGGLKHAGAGSGEGRLEKIKLQEDSRR